MTRMVPTAGPLQAALQPGADTDMAEVIAVSLSPTHDFSKKSLAAIYLIAGLGVAGDAHMGSMVQHR
jgi:hypothetical protein